MTETPGALALRENQALAADVNTALTAAQLRFISATEFVPRAYRGNLPAIMACVATGRALGLADMSSLRSIHVIDGKASFSAELMVQLARKAGHSITGQMSATEAVVTGKRADNGDTMTVKWTIDDAKRVGLLSKDVWKKYPEDMLWARAVSALCRRLFADCFAGASYTPEELGAGTDVTADELMDEEPAGELVNESDKTIEQLTAELLDLADTLDARAAVENVLADHADDADWLHAQIASARETIAQRELEALQA